ncbi:MAG: Fe-Mn family superoxide dismutase [Patescibacteria group bacterium]
MAIEPRKYTWEKPLTGISEKTLQIHQDTLYQGYVKKANEISQKLNEFCMNQANFDAPNQSYSHIRGLKEGETFARNGVYLHEWYFSVLGGSGEPTGTLVDALVEKMGSLENFYGYFKACGMAARGWAVLCWDMRAQTVKVYTADAHNQGGVWGCIPLIVLDVYEHAYFMDYGANRGAYIDDFFKNLDWSVANEYYEKARKCTL